MPPRPPGDGAATPVPRRAETLEVLRLMGEHEPILMLPGDEDGYGTRWTIHGMQVQPGIARYLMDAGYLAESGRTQLGARRLMLTESGRRFRAEGAAWWAGLGFVEKLRIRLFG
ncbi:MAG: hypothetical protein JNK22_18370 [Rhodocyclaceae bacterium]|nr:hypothetical protein [Rhodocyclaceae bacterium]